VPTLNLQKFKIIFKFVSNKIFYSVKVGTIGRHSRDKLSMVDNSKVKIDRETFLKIFLSTTCNIKSFLRHTMWGSLNLFPFLLLVTLGGSGTQATGMEIWRATNLPTLTPCAIELDSSVLKMFTLTAVQ